MPVGARRWFPVACACLALAVTACGEDAETTDQKANAADRDKTVRSEASEPPRVFVERLAKLLATTKSKDECKAIALINGRSNTRFACPPSPALARSMARLEILDTEEHGTGALVEYRSGREPDGAAAVLFADDSRNWAISRFGVQTEPSIGTDDAKSRAGYDRAVEDYLTAVEQRDCEAFEAVAFTGGETGGEVCKGSFAETKALAKRLKADPDAKPKYQGGNATYGFYVLKTAKPDPERGTISVVRAGAGADAAYVVLDYATPVSISVQ